MQPTCVDHPRGWDSVKITGRKIDSPDPALYVVAEGSRCLQVGGVQHQCVRRSAWSEQDSFGLARIIDQAKVVVERGACIDAELIVEHVVNIQYDLLRLGPCDHTLEIIPRVGDSDWKLLGAARAEGGGPAGLGDHDLPPGIFQLDLIVGGVERVEACFRADPDRLVVGVGSLPVPGRVDVHADEVQEGEQLLRASVGEPECRCLRRPYGRARKVSLRLLQVFRDDAVADHVRVLVTDKYALDVAPRYGRLDKALVVVGRPIVVVGEQKEAQEEVQVGVLGDLADIDDAPAILWIIRPQRTEVLLRSGEIRHDLGRCWCLRGMQAIVGDARIAERDSGHGQPPVVNSAERLERSLPRHRPSLWRRAAHCRSAATGTPHKQAGPETRGSWAEADSPVTCNCRIRRGRLPPSRFLPKRLVGKS